VKRTSTLPADVKARMKIVRAAATNIREGKPGPPDRRLAHLAKRHLRNRAQYNARRKKVRDLAARIRRGESPKAAADLLDAARRWLAYRKRYNAERRVGRR
jgi:hypothetical protein